MSEMSSPTSNSTTVTEEKDPPTLACVVKRWKTKELIDFLRKEEDLDLSETAIKILEKEEINGRDFLKITKEELRSYEMPGGPASRLADFAKDLSKRKLRAYSSYKSLKEVLRKYKLDSDGIEIIPLFKLVTCEIQDSDKHLAHCMAEIMIRLKNYGSLVVDSLEAMRNEYVVAILHTALNIARDDTQKEFSMRPQYEIVGNESTGRVDYAIKDSENLICITEDKQHQIPVGIAQNIRQLESSYETNKKKRKASDTFGDYDDFDYLPGEISLGSKLPYTIEFTEDALNEKSEEYQILRKSVKKVLGVVVEPISQTQSTTSSEIKIPYNQKVEQGLICELSTFINEKSLSNSMSDKQILENTLDGDDLTPEYQKVIGVKNLHMHVTEPSGSNDIEVSASPEEKGYQVLSEKINNPENRKNSKNNTLNLFPLKKMLSKEKRKEEGEHQSDAYWVLGSHCPLCRGNHTSLKSKWWLDSRSKNTYYLHCTNLKEPGIPYDDVLKAYSGNSELIQELKTQCFTSPIPWNNVLILPDK
ncbi:1315_t:CDS:2, partial [Gigaspora margarita]